MDEGMNGGSVADGLQAHAGLEHLKEGFYAESFAQQHFVQHGHQMVFHLAANTGNQGKIPLPEALQQQLEKIALIRKNLPL